jgi:hypothetical protein
VKVYCYTSIVFLFLFLTAFVSADNVTLVAPQNATSCLAGENVTFAYIPVEDSLIVCNLLHNESGEMQVEAATYNPTVKSTNSFTDTLRPSDYLWTVECDNDTTTFYTGFNWTFTLTDFPYCAVLSETTCNKDAPLNGFGAVRTRLGNTNGIYLENQDCAVSVKNAAGELVKTFPTMLYNDKVNRQLDTEGNWINVAEGKVPLTDSGGYYTYQFPITNDWAWVGDEFTVEVTCNGITETCDFNVTSERLPDMENYRQLGRMGGGLLALFIIGSIVIAALFYPPLKTRIFRIIK